MSTARELAGPKIRELVDKYNRIKSLGREDEYSEEDVKVKFINPFLEALGWDVRGLDEVKLEQRTLTGRVDFGLRIRRSEKPKIFYEIKKFDENLDGYRTRFKRKETYAEIVINYAWHMKVDWAVLTNFKETRLYYTHVKKPSEGLVFKWSYDKYLEKFDDLWMLSKESVISGLLDALEKRRTRKTVEETAPEDLFLCRRILVRDINKNNPRLSVAELRESVQRILNRLVVVRVAEDRNIIRPDSLWKKLVIWRETRVDESALFIKDLKQFFRQFDNVYNSKLFEEHPCEDLNISNRILDLVLSILYKYNFDLIEADVLGSIYETYLGHILKETEGGFEIVTDYSTRKEEGIYYTPTHIVEYIVQNTLGELLKKREPQEVGMIKVLDPACGSGSFLIKAYDYIKNCYDEHNREILESAKNSGELKGYGKIIENVENKILTENLFGVDLDPQATEIAAVNLMLKALRKGEKLPLILEENIKLGNSLISGSSEELSRYFADPQEKRPFNWKQQFPEIFARGGFDCVIGNPPWTLQLTKEEKKYFRAQYSTAFGKLDLYRIFLHKVVELMREGGKFGFICPNTWLTIPAGKKLRKFVLDNTQIDQIVALPLGVFDVAQNYVLVFWTRKTDRKEIGDVEINILSSDSRPTDLLNQNFVKSYKIPQNRWLENEDFIFNIFADEQTLTLLRKIETDCIPLEKICECAIGLQAYHNTLHTPEEIRKRIYHADYKKDDTYKKELSGKDIARYFLKWNDKDWISYGDWLYNSPPWRFFSKPRILVREIAGNRIVATYTEEEYCNYKTLLSVVLREDTDYSLKFILGLINSKLLSFYFKHTASKSAQALFPRVSMNDLKKLPIHLINFLDEEKKRLHDTVDELVGTIVLLNKQKNWIIETFKEMVAKFEQDREFAPLSYYYNIREPERCLKYGLNVVKSGEFIDHKKEAIPTGYKVKSEDSNLILGIKYHDTDKYESVLKLFFEDKNLKEFFHLAITLSAGKKNYRSPKKILDTVLSDMTIPKYVANVDEDVENIRILMNILEKVYRKEVKEKFQESPIQELSLGKIEHKIEEIDRAIDKNVYELYGLTQEERRIVEDSFHQDPWS